MSPLAPAGVVRPAGKMLEIFFLGSEPEKPLKTWG